MYIYVYVYIYMYMYILVYIYIYMCIYIYILKLRRSPPIIDTFFRNVRWFGFREYRILPSTFWPDRTVCGPERPTCANPR